MMVFKGYVRRKSERQVGKRLHIITDTTMKKHMKWSEEILKIG